MLGDGSRLSELLLNLYEGVHSESSWMTGLDRISDAFRGSALFFGSLAPDGSSSMVGHGIDPACAALIGGPLATPAANPFISPMMTKAVGKAIPTALMCGDAALVRSPLFDQALRPHSQRYAIGAMLELNGGAARTIALTREARQGDYDEDEVQLLNQLLPHLAGALQLRAIIGKLNGQSAAAYALLESVERGIVIFSVTQEIAFANAEARRIFQLGDGLTATSAGLVISEQRAADRLRKALRAAVGSDLGATIIPEPICVSRPSGKLPFAISVTMANGLSAGCLDMVRQSVTVTIIDPERESCPSQLLLRQIYGLTVVEARLAAALCDLDLKHAAETLGISVNTAKTHLQAIFQKVGVSRQSALVRKITLHTDNR